MFKRSILVGAALAVAALFSPALAADITFKAPAGPLLTYPTSSGWFWGVSASGMGGQTGSTNGLATGNLIGAKGGLDIGYTGRIGQAFWFVEQNFNAQAIQGPGNGLAISAAFSMEQRYAFGVPQSVASQFMALLPGANGQAMPSISFLPAGVTLGPANYYVFASTWEDDVSASIGTATGRSWLFSYGAGTGIIFRGSNGWAFDTSVEWKHGAGGLLVGALPGGAVMPFNDTFLGTVRVKF